MTESGGGARRGLIHARGEQKPAFNRDRGIVRVVVEGRYIPLSTDFVTPDDVKVLAVHVLAHRLVDDDLVGDGSTERREEVVRDLVGRQEVPV